MVEGLPPQLKLLQIGLKKPFLFWGSFVGTPKKSGQIIATSHVHLAPKFGGLVYISGKSPGYFREGFPGWWNFLSMNFDTKIGRWKTNSGFPVPYSQPISFGNLPKNAWVRASWCSTSVGAHNSGESSLIHWNYPPPSNSHHQDYSIFSRESL